MVVWMVWVHWCLVEPNAAACSVSRTKQIKNVGNDNFGAVRTAMKAGDFFLFLRRADVD